MTSRARVAAACMLTGVAVGPAGAYLEWGVGPALLLACVLLVLVSILLGWGA